MTSPALAYHEYLVPAMFAPHAQLMLARAAIQPHERVLDVACGTGVVTSQVKAARVVGLDISPAMIEVASKWPGIELVLGSGTAMPLPDASFDVVLCQQGLQFFPDRVAGAREFRRVLGDGGRAVVACWLAHEHQQLFADVVRAQAAALGVGVEQVAMPFSFGDGEALRTLLRDAGFSRVDVERHTITTRFPDPAKFVRMCVDAAIAVMPARFGQVAPEPFAATVEAELEKALARYQNGSCLQFLLTTNVAIAFV